MSSVTPARLSHPVTIHAEAWIDGTHFGEDILKRIQNALTYTNPKWIQTKRMGFSTYNIPNSIFNFRREDHYLIIPRGEITKAWPILMENQDFRERAGAKDWQTACPRPEDHIFYENKDFELSAHQKRCVDAIASANQGIILAATSAGKSAIIMAAIGRMETNVLIVVNRKILVQQLKKDAKKWLNVPIGEISGEKFDLQDVTIATDKSLLNALERGTLKGDEFGAIFVDEVHTSAVPTMQAIMSRISSKRRYGLTGTLKRKDGFEFLVYGQFGTVIAEVTRGELEEVDRVSPVKINVVETSCADEKGELDAAETPSEVWRMSDKLIHADKSRLTYIAYLVLELLEADPNKKIAIAWRYLDPCYALFDELELNRNVPCAVITGKEDQEAELQKIKRGDVRVVIATIPCFATGVDVPDLTDLILASPMFSNELLLKQLRGRLMRKAEGKTHGTFHVIFDPLLFPNYKLKSCLRMLEK